MRPSPRAWPVVVAVSIVLAPGCDHEKDSFLLDSMIEEVIDGTGNHDDLRRLDTTAPSWVKGPPAPRFTGETRAQAADRRHMVGLGYTRIDPERDGAARQRFVQSFGREPKLNGHYFPTYPNPYGYLPELVRIPPPDTASADADLIR